jgi:DNA-binding LacI/PurR family transcriptional regulator
MGVTQQDIARIAKVSQATVSRVLAGDDKVDGVIRSRVVQAIREHNYQPDVRARSLRSKRTGLIGLVVKRPHGGLAGDPFFSSLTAAILDHFTGKPYHLCLDMVTDESLHEAVYDEMLRTRRVDGLILVESKTQDERIHRLQADRFPFVLIGNAGPEAEIWSVDNDNVLGAEIATKHLLDNGYRRVGILGGPSGLTVSDDRIAGYQRALRGRQSEVCVWHADFGVHDARTCALQLLAEADRPDALVVLDDFMAMGVVLAARTLGIRIPDQLGLVSFNDSNLCDVLDCGLSSVSLNIHDLAGKSCEVLMRLIEGRLGSQPKHLIVPSALKVRGSSQRLVGVGL